MASIPQVVAGAVATAAAQNSLIGQVNANTGQIFGDSSRSVAPYCKVCVTADTGWQTLPYGPGNGTSGGNRMLNWETEVYDTDNMFAGTGTNSITVPVDGLYLSQLSLNLATQTGTVTGAIGVKLLSNTADPDPAANGGNNVLDTNTAPFNVAGEGSIIKMTSIVSVAAGTALRVSAWHNFNNGSGLNVGVWSGFGNRGTAWAVTYLGK
ncbi:hypothetical protein [Saccharopolyspora shandongensis]|uniref:hypothetical protein n=1 Tax=Saccharopolyspora shandongensis TaxID=418495 RepID=UPI0033D36591